MAAPFFIPSLLNPTPFFGFLISALLTALFAEANAQNLIPNPGFEDVLTPEEYNWVQPQGPYYHYERKSESMANGANSGDYLNGICMYAQEPNEYLHVKLKDTLRAGDKYVFTVFAKLMPSKAVNPANQQYIGVFFGTERLNTHIPGDMYLKPQLQLQLPEYSRFDWFVLRDTLTATGGEHFMTLGYFPELHRRAADEKAADNFMAEVEREYAAAARRAEPKEENDKSWLYLPPGEQKAYLKNKKKEDRKARRKRSRLNKKMQGDCPSPSDGATRTRKSRSMIEGSDGSAIPFVVRYYFDDFCLAPLIGDKAICSEEYVKVEKERLREGSVFSLQNVFFDLDEATLLEESEVQLDALRNLLEERPALEIEIRGHTDNQGSESHNADLSKRRAAAVVNWLIARGIDSRRLSSQGFGATSPAASNNDEAGRARNRRVEFYVVKGDGQ